jgi:hypothetical protein
MPERTVRRRLKEGDLVVLTENWQEVLPLSMDLMADLQELEWPVRVKVDERKDEQVWLEGMSFRSVNSNRLQLVVPQDHSPLPWHEGAEQPSQVDQR